MPLSLSIHLSLSCVIRPPAAVIAPAFTLTTAIKVFTSLLSALFYFIYHCLYVFPSGPRLSVVLCFISKCTFWLCALTILPLFNYYYFSYYFHKTLYYLFAVCCFSFAVPVITLLSISVLLQLISAFKFRRQKTRSIRAAAIRASTSDTNTSARPLAAPAKAPSRFSACRSAVYHYVPPFTVLPCMSGCILICLFILYCSLSLHWLCFILF